MNLKYNHKLETVQKEDIITARKLKPKTLTPDEDKEWNHLAPILVRHGRLRPANLYFFEEYVSLLCRLKEWRILLSKEGWTYECNGMIRTRPEAQLYMQQQRDIGKYVAEFGLGPKSDASLNRYIQIDEDEDDGFDDF